MTRTLTLVFADAAEDELRITITKPQQMQSGSKIDTIGKAIVATGAVAVEGNPVRVCTQFIRAYYTMQMKEAIDLG